MQLNKPPTAPEFDTKHRKMEAGVEPLTVKAGLVMALSKTPGSSSKSGAAEPKVSLASCILGSLKFMKESSENKTLATTAQTSL